MAINIISVQLVDDAGNTGNHVLPVPGTATLAQIQTFANAYLLHLDAMTGAKINKASVSLSLTLPGTLKAAAVADHPLQWGANFAFDAANTTYRHTVRVPAIDQGLVTAGVVDTAPLFVQDWIADIVNGDGVVAPTDRYENDITAFIEAAATFRKS